MSDLKSNKMIPVMNREMVNRVFSRSTRAPRSVIQAVSRWDVFLIWKNRDIFIPVFRIRRMMPLAKICDLEAAMRRC